MQEFGDGTNDVFFLRVTANPPLGSDVTAGIRLSNGYPEVMSLNPGETLTLRSDVAITSVYVVAVGDTESLSLAAGEIVERDTGTSTAANYQTAAVKFEFDADDDVRLVTITATERYSAGTAGAPVATANFVEATVLGASYA